MKHRLQRVDSLHAYLKALSVRGASPFIALVLSCLCWLALPSYAAQTHPKIHLSQLGFPNKSGKVAVITDTKSVEFFLIEAKSQEEMLRGPLSAAKPWAPADEQVKIADFSNFERAGTYFIRVPGVGESHPFRIGERVYDQALEASIKAFYFNRASAALEPRHAGVWHRPAGHPDTIVYMYPPMAGKKLGQGRAVLSSPKGWYDAGDYNKYVVNTAITAYTLLKAVEHGKDRVTQLNLKIPESQNDLPDVIDEILWGLDWMLSMQDSGDGGVYHKLTTLQFTGDHMPHTQYQPRYMMPKSTSATLGFAASMAYASRLLAQQSPALKARADRYLAAAMHAWTWASQHPNTPYKQPEDVNTGSYARYQDDFVDEFNWAATELFLATDKKTFLKRINLPTRLGTPAWGANNTLAALALAAADQVPDKVKAQSVALLKQYGKQALENYWGSGYLVGLAPQDFVWGSNGVAMNKAMTLLQVYAFDNNIEYLHAARALLDYIFGRNPTGYAYVTGVGLKTPMHIHHRVSVADGVKAPVPGFLAGGPHGEKKDKCTYSSKAPAKRYLDDYCSYATNEVAINWNAPLFYVLSVIPY